MQPPGSLIADVGCGNGKYLGVNCASYKLGSDICPELVSIARQRGHEVAVCDCLRLPYKKDLFDAAICIAVVHHLSTEERRLAALRELSRILRPGGNLLVYVWAMEQDGRKFDRQDVLVPWHLQPKYSVGANPNPTAQAGVHRRRKKHGNQMLPQQRPGADQDGVDTATPITSADAATRGTSATHTTSPSRSDDTILENLSLSTKKQSQSTHDKSTEHSESLPYVSTDGIAPSNSSDRPHLRELGYETFLRYYHVFQKGELSDLIARGVSDLVVKEEVFDHDNWCVTAQKVLKI